MELEGQVVKQPFAVGTKSEREAIYLESAQGKFLLHRPGTNPLEIDRDLEALTGRKVRCSGFLRGHTFVVSNVAVLDEP